MKTESPFVLALFAAAALSTAMAMPVEISSDLSVNADVAENDADCYNVRVMFFPVSTLDKVTNEEMTEVLARFYVEEALSSSLGKSKAVSFTKLNASRSDANGGKCSWSYTIPKSAVIDAPEETVERHEDLAKSFAATGKSDIADLFKDFRSRCFRDLRTAEALFSEQAEACAGDPGKFAEFQRHADAALDSLSERIKEDGDLFRAEKKEMLEKVEKVRAYIHDTIGSDAGTALQPTSRLGNRTAFPIADGKFVEPFGEVIRSDALFLTRECCRIVKTPDGKRMLIAVGWSAIPDEERGGEISRQTEERSRVRAYAAAAKFKGEEVVVTSWQSREAEISFRNKEETSIVARKSSERTEINAMEYIEEMEIVGTWFSIDHDRFFMAKGCMVK